MLLKMKKKMRGETFYFNLKFWFIFCRRNFGSITFCICRFSGDENVHQLGLTHIMEESLSWEVNSTLI